MQGTVQGHLLLIDRSGAVGRQWASVQPAPIAAALVTLGLLPGRLGACFLEWGVVPPYLAVSSFLSS